MPAVIKCIYKPPIKVVMDTKCVISKRVWSVVLAAAGLFSAPLSATLQAQEASQTAQADDVSLSEDGDITAAVATTPPPASCNCLPTAMPPPRNTSASTVAPSAAVPSARVSTSAAAAN